MSIVEKRPSVKVFPLPLGASALWTLYVGQHISNKVRTALSSAFFCASKVTSSLPLPRFEVLGFSRGHPRTCASQRVSSHRITSHAVFDEDVHDMYDFTGPVLGSGAFATVLRVKDRVSGVEYAIKQVSA